MLTADDVVALKKAVTKNPRSLMSMSEGDQLAAAQAIVALEDERYARDPYAWAIEQVQTRDEASRSILPFPDKPYLHDLFDALDRESLLAIPKSRRMVVTWAVSTYMTHQARFLKHFAGFVQSDTETKAAYVVDERIKFIEDHLPPVYRRPYKEHKTVKGAVGKMVWTGTGSTIVAIAQGKDAFRTYTPTLIFMDEIEFQEQGHQSFVAALPFAEKDCKIVIVSSSGGPHGVLADMARAVGFKRFS